MLLMLFRVLECVYFIVTKAAEVMGEISARIGIAIMQNTKPLRIYEGHVPTQGTFTYTHVILSSYIYKLLQKLTL